MLNKINFKTTYNSKSDNIIKNFYIPALENSISYDRISAYFDSKILKMYSSGLEYLCNRNGKIRFIFSCDISDKDYILMKKGYELRKEYEEKLLSSLNEEDINLDLSNLAHLIAKGYVDIKIAFTKNGIFHDKYGLFIDEGGNILYFRGSNNETMAAIISNYESFETSKSWDCDFNEMKKINIAKENFEKIWNDDVDGIITLPLPFCVKDKLLSFSTKSINYIYHTKENALIFDIDDNNNYFIYNNLDNQMLVSENSMIYKFKLRGYVNKIKENKMYLNDMSYIKLNELIDIIKGLSIKYNFNVCITPILRQYLFEKDLVIEKRKNVGIAIKHKDPLVIDDFNKFKEIVNTEMVRKLREPQMWDAYHIVTMIKSANFSVPGSGKTSIVYGAFAYLSSLNKVDKIVMIGPKNSFLSWKKEFVNNFGNKKLFNYLDIHEDSEIDKKNRIKYYSAGKNLILVNYESVPNMIDELNQIIDEKTMLIFDEIHRIKGIDGKRANACLSISKNAIYKVALTGTPIPNSYKDIYNLLHILYYDEYDTFFNFKVSELNAAYNNPVMIEKINNLIYPFFCRTTKKQLLVPEPYDDDISSGVVVMDDVEQKIIEIIYNTFNSNPLLLFIRLMQASSNPLLVLEKLEISDFVDNMAQDDYYNELNDAINDEKNVISSEDYDFIKNYSKTRKIDLCSELITNDVRKGKKVIAWGVFIKNLYLLSEKLEKNGIKTAIISGETKQSERDLIIENFEKGIFDVLITNPHTLAESISLHKICHQAYYFEYSFNLTHMLQSRDRIHRLGIDESERPNYTYMFLTAEDDSLYDTIDQRIYHRLKEKEKIMIDAVENSDIQLIEDNYIDDIIEILNM